MNKKGYSEKRIAHRRSVFSTTRMLGEVFDEWDPEYIDT